MTDIKGYNLINTGVVDQMCFNTETHHFSHPPAAGWSCSACARNKYMYGNDGFYYCNDCKLQIEDAMETQVADEDFVSDDGIVFYHVPLRSKTGLVWVCGTCEGSKFVNGHDCTDCQSETETLELLTD